MILFFVLGALALIEGAGMARDIAAQATGKVSPQGPERPRPTVPPPVPPRIYAPPPPPQADSLAPFIKASAAVDGLDGWTADFLASDEAAGIRLRGGGPTKIYPLSNPDEALMFLADRRVEGLWPAILDWAGAGLERLRDRNIAAAEAAASAGDYVSPESTTTSAVRPHTRAQIIAANRLADAGRFAEAIAKLEAERGARPDRSGWGRDEWSVLTIRLAAFQWRLNGLEAALKTLDAGKAALGKGDGYGLNIDVTRAAFLVEQGRFADALAAIVPAHAEFLKFSGSRGGKNGDKVAGSDRQFAWIRACALHGLGRIEEADKVAASFLITNEPRDTHFIISPNAAIRYRYARCIRDVPAAAQNLVRGLESTLVGGEAFRVLQPGYLDPDVDDDFLAKLRADPDINRALAGRLRALPADLMPALNHWRDVPALHRPSPPSPPLH